MKRTDPSQKAQVPSKRTTPPYITIVLAIAIFYPSTTRASSKQSPQVTPASLDGAVAEFSPERYARLNQFYKDWQQDLARVPFDRLSAVREDLVSWNRYYSGYDPMFTWWAARPYTQADQALTAYIKALREKPRSNR